MKRTFAFVVLWVIRAVLAAVLACCLGILAYAFINIPMEIIASVIVAIAGLLLIVLLGFAYEWAKRTIMENGGGK